MPGAEWGRVLHGPDLVQANPDRVLERGGLQPSRDHRTGSAISDGG